MTVWLSLLGGMALFAYGLTLTTEALARLTSGSLKQGILLATRHAWSAGLFGLAATLLAGSSSAVTVLAVGFVNAGLVPLRRALQVILGAAVGTTLTVQLVSFHITRFAPVILFLGAAILFAERVRGATSPAGPLVLGFGFIFYGMMVMVGAAPAIVAQPAAAAAFLVLAHVPLLPFAAALVFTAVLQNSATTIALVISFALHGAISPLTGLEMVLGANVGSTAPSVYAALMGTRAARRTALAYVVMKSAGALAALALVRPVTALLAALEPNAGRLLADGHTLFNLVNGLVFLPLAGPLAARVERWLPDPEPKAASRLLDPSLLSRPSEALAQSWLEVVRLARIIETEMISRLPVLVAGPSDADRRALAEAETDVDLLHLALHAYLARLNRGRRTDEEVEAQFLVMSLANHLEHVSDTLVKVGETAEKLAQREFTWDPGLFRRLDDFIRHLARDYGRVVTAMADRDRAGARAVVQDHPERVREEEAVRYEILAAAHRLNTAALAALLELLDDLALLGQRVAGLGRILLGTL
ncbi:MAG: Na/Pi symporter [Actinomycetia bacterium]|nr:Na/Pi symporter [Actinomycetes bacterium]